MATDERLGDVASWWFGMNANESLPLAIRGNASLSGFDYAVLEESWSTVGAQVHPTPNIVLAPATLEQFLSGTRIVYIAGSPGERVYVVQLDPP